MRMILLCTLLLTSGLLGAQGQHSDGTIEGTVVVPTGISLPPDTTVFLTSCTGARRSTLPNADGSFTFFAAEDGAYTVEVEAVGLMYPTIKVVKKNGAYIASIPEAIGTPGVVYPLRMAPVAKVTYYEQRQGFNILSFLKTPYGMMIGFMVFSMVIMPYLKVDQEEYKQMVQERQRLTSAVTGGGGSSNSGGGGSRRDRRD